VIVRHPFIEYHNRSIREIKQSRVLQLDTAGKPLEFRPFERSSLFPAPANTNLDLRSRTRTRYDDLRG